MTIVGKLTIGDVLDLHEIWWPYKADLFLQSLPQNEQIKTDTIRILSDVGRGTVLSASGVAATSDGTVT
jgi:hypothetical protein